MVNSVEPRFPGDGEGKRNLPFPYNSDLSGVLRHLSGCTPEGRARLANDPLTASFLCAGKLLLDQHLGPERHCECTPHHDSRSLLSFLSQRNIVSALPRIDTKFPKRGSPRSLRDRWEPHEGFVADLISFVFWIENYRPGFREDRESVTDRLVHDQDFIHAVQDTAYWHTAEGVKLPSVRLSLALMAIAAEDPDTAEAISAAYRDYLGSWQGLYRDVMRARGLQLRTGLTIDDLANALSAAADGTILRASGDPTVSVLDRDRRWSQLGDIVLAILNSFLERIDNPDGLTLEQAVANHLGV
jgi:hypothetical protein